MIFWVAIILQLNVLNAQISSGSSTIKQSEGAGRKKVKGTSECLTPEKFTLSFHLTHGGNKQRICGADKSLRCCVLSKKVRASSPVNMPFYWRRDEGQSGKRRRAGAAQPRLRSWSFWATLSSSDSMAARAFNLSILMTEERRSGH